MAGLLYVVATPIGNLEDITYRAVRVLGEADLIACEDTRQTRKLLDHYNIHKPTVSYHDHNEAERTEELTARLVSGAARFYKQARKLDIRDVDVRKLIEEDRR